MLRRKTTVLSGTDQCRRELDVTLLGYRCRSLADQKGHGRTRRPVGMQSCGRSERVANGSRETRVVSRRVSARQGRERSGPGAIETPRQTQTDVADRSRVTIGRECCGDGSPQVKLYRIYNNNCSFWYL